MADNYLSLNIEEKQNFLEFILTLPDDLPEQIIPGSLTDETAHQVI